mmetsp:Transcript_42294/g.80843  ORF Transcript_42294/g.80843 Transcript_42294/m.80843 type:complete len:206 (+) Transcript_42294:293-910(+)
MFDDGTSNFDMAEGVVKVGLSMLAVSVSIWIREFGHLCDGLGGVFVHEQLAYADAGVHVARLLGARLLVHPDALLPRLVRKRPHCSKLPQHTRQIHSRLEAFCVLGNSRARGRGRSHLLLWSCCLSCFGGGGRGGDGFCRRFGSRCTCFCKRWLDHWRLDSCRSLGRRPSSHRGSDSWLGRCRFGTGGFRARRNFGRGFYRGACL